MAIDALRDITKSGVSAWAAGGGNPTLTLDGSPTAADANTTKLFTTSVGNGKMLPAYIGPTGLYRPVQPHLGRARVIESRPVANVTTLHIVGTTQTATGTATAATIATTNIHTITRRLEYAVTTASATAVAGWRQAANQFHMGTPYGGFYLACVFGPSRGVASNATRRGFVGLSSNTAAPTDADPTSGTTWANMMGVGHDAADTNWQFMYRSGTGAVTKVGTGIAKAYSDNTEMFRLEMFVASSATPTLCYSFTRLSTGTNYSGTVSSGLPASTQLLQFGGWNSVGGTSSVIGIAFGGLYVETEY